MVDEDCLKFSDEPNQSVSDDVVNDDQNHNDDRDDRNSNSTSCRNEITPTRKGVGRKLFIGFISVVVVIGTGVGIWLGVLFSSGDKQQSNHIRGNGTYNDNGDIYDDINAANHDADKKFDSISVSAPNFNGIGTSIPTAIESEIETQTGTDNEIADIIYDIARYGGSEFVDPDSYQSRAKSWVLSHNYPIQDSSQMTIKQQAIQLYALACIYYSTFAVRSEWTDIHFGSDVLIPGWFVNQGWLRSPEDVCSNWHGITCNENGRIIKIELDTNGLTGYFAPETKLLHETLMTIDLYNNIVHNVGHEGNSWLGELTNLEHLYLGTTFFEYDGIPSELGNLSKLKELDFSYSLYFGDISQSGPVFAKLSNLKYLVMDGNAYNSSLPSDLVRLPKLEYLHAGHSFLKGGLDFVPSMTNIYELWLDDNPDLMGTIPSGVGSLSRLASFGASNCGLRGIIPTEMGLMTDMIQLWLNHNSLTGEIPSEFGNLVTMKNLKLQNNQLIGTMPANICSRRRPFGRLDELGADCDNAISCTTECCTCCGAECMI